MLGSVYGYQCCSECGLSVPVGQLAAGTHVCDDDAKAAYQAARLPNEIADYLRSPHGIRHERFVGWLREHHR